MENRTSFGLDADKYRRYRPVYPAALFQYLAGVCERRRTALDCATGNGQAAIALTSYFDSVVATDTDPAQIAAAQRNDKVRYEVAAAESLPQALGLFDLVTIAQGAHWFDLPAFYRRLQPLLMPRAIIAIFGYSYCKVSPEFDAILKKLLIDRVDAFWAEGNRVIMDGYRKIDFPFDEMSPPPFTIRVRWDRDSLFGFFRTWSAYKRLLANGLSDPLPEVAAALDENSQWPPNQPREIHFDIAMRVGHSKNLNT